MEIYLTDLETGDRFRFPMAPEKINVKTGQLFQAYTILAIGDVKIPSGEELTGFSWSGTLPGKVREKAPYVSEWRSPHDIQSQWSVYRAQKKKLKLMATETPINHNVYIQSYSVEYGGGYGDYTYDISFIQAKDLKVYASGVSGQSTGTADTVESKPEGMERPSPPPPKTYIVVKGDSLWSIAQKQMGNGDKYPRLYEANKAAIDPRNQLYRQPKYTIYPGQKLTIPS
jgi:nucleoid-associated protein YgaU